MMKFGLWLQPLHHPSENPTLGFERDLKLIELFDQLGFDDVWIGEHHSTGWEPIGSPEVFMAMAAARTKYITIGSGIIPLSIHHPLHVLERASLLDHLTRGRSRLGIGVGGGLPSDLHVFGIDRDEARKRFNESFDVIIRLLSSDEPITEDKGWYKMNEAILQLKPYKNLTITAATVNPDTLRKLGTIDGHALLGVHPDQVSTYFKYIEEGAASVGKIASRNQISLVTNLYLADTNAEAFANIRESILRERDEFYAVVNGYTMKPEDPDAWLDKYLERGIIGTPQEAIEKIISMLEASDGGIGGLIFTVKDWGDPRALRRSYELFARYVMPHFNGSLTSLHKAATLATGYNAKKQVRAA